MLKKRLKKARSECRSLKKRTGNMSTLKQETQNRAGTFLAGCRLYIARSSISMDEKNLILKSGKPKRPITK